MITLRNNQTEPINRAIGFFNSENPKPSLIVLPTAWGKSILTAFVAQSTKDKLIVLQPSKELLEQNYRKYINLCGDFCNNAAIYSASCNSKRISQITYATIGSIKDLGASFKRLGFTKMLIDEAHLYPREADSMLGKFLQESGITHVLGITATPVKLQTNYDASGNRFSKLSMLTSKSKKGNFYRDIICVGQISEMVENRYWSPLIYHAAHFDDKLLVYNTSKSEFTDESVKNAYDTNNIGEAIDKALRENRDRKHVLVFVPSVAEAVEFANRYDDSAAIYGDMDKKERERVIADFRTGLIRTIFNVRVLSTGFDYTGIDCIILGFSTASIALYYQIIGRATRIDDGKDNALIVDLGGNVARFGRVEDICFEKDKIWRMYGSSGRLLSGIPIVSIGTVTRDDIIREKKMTVEVMPFGKYRGIALVSVPEEYRRWCLKNFDWKPSNENLRESILASLTLAAV